MNCLVNLRYNCLVLSRVHHGWKATTPFSEGLRLTVQSELEKLRDTTRSLANVVHILKCCADKVYAKFSSCTVVMVG